MMDPGHANPLITRRNFFDRAVDGLFGASLAYLFSRDVRADERRQQAGMMNLVPKVPHFAPRARSVIYLCMQGGPSQVDLFDPKPALTRHHGGTPPRSLTQNAVFETDRRGVLMGSPWRFRQHGQSGAWVSELLPHISQQVDDLAIIRSMYNVHPNHEPAVYKLQSGQTFPGHPTFGSWITYGLGTENQNLPAYVVLADPVERLPTNGVENWLSGYLSPLYQGTPMRPTGSPLVNLRPDFREPAGVTLAKKDLVARLDRMHQQRRFRQVVLDARIRNYEMAARMQLEATEALDLASETAETRAMYGLDQPGTDSFGRRCLMARRLVEQGVRFVQLFPKGQAWDNHRNIAQTLPDICRKTDLPIAALLRDLKRRGLLDTTLVLWGGEFGRLPMAQNAAAANDFKGSGRDHGPYGFTTWMAGGGVRGGVVHGSTDEIGYGSVDKRVSIQDWHATILHLLGMNHEELVFNRNGLDDRLTHQFETRVVKEVLL